MLHTVIEDTHNFGRALIKCYAPPVFFLCLILKLLRLGLACFSPFLVCVLLAPGQCMYVYA